MKIKLKCKINLPRQEAIHACNEYMSLQYKHLQNWTMSENQSQLSYFRIIFASENAISQRMIIWKLTEIQAGIKTLYVKRAKKKRPINRNEMK